MVCSKQQGVKWESNKRQAASDMTVSGKLQVTSGKVASSKVASSMAASSKQQVARQQVAAQYVIRQQAATGNELTA